MSENQNTPLWKQLLGAATGATVALLLYGGFVAVSPNLSGVTAYLLSDFEEKIEDMPVPQRSPRTIRNDAIAWREALGDRARAATARLQKGENYFPKGPASPPPTASVPSKVKEEKKEVGNQQQEGEVALEEVTKPSPANGQDNSLEQGGKKQTDEKRKEEKLPDTGIPLWAIGGVALCLAMSVRYRRKILGNH
ncbi:hypothetical protein HYW84_03460 [Candidatus Peregrinibacteria bacterium]|nr:hypothetical protein [Candidatus Peregrinibacteria bacterium]